MSFLSRFQETANTSFSPDGRVLVCGSNVPPKTNATGVLKFFDVYTSETSPELGEGEGGTLPCACKLDFVDMRCSRSPSRSLSGSATLFYCLLVVVVVLVVVVSQFFGLIIKTRDGP